MDFSRAGCSLISLSGRATSISFFLYVVESLRSGGWKVIGFPMAFGLRFWADEKPCLFSMLGFPIRFGLGWIGLLCGGKGRMGCGIPAARPGGAEDVQLALGP